MTNYPIQSQTQLNAGQLVGMVRNELQIFSQFVLRSGFPDDPLDDDGMQIYATPILFYVNEGQRELRKLTGYTPCREVLTINTPVITAGAPSVCEYFLGQDTTRIIDAMINGQALNRTYLQRLDLTRSGWANPNGQQQSQPTSYYTLADMIGFYPIPDQMYQVYILTSPSSSDLVNEADVPTRLPNDVMPALAAYAALKLNNMVEIENQMAPQRIARLQNDWDTAVAELLVMVNARGDDDSSRIAVWDYRNFFSPWGGFQAGPPGWGAP
jgi:hypothetical protein